MLTASSMSAVMRRGVDTATSTPHDSSNIHSFLGLLTRATVRGTPNSVLASSESTRLALSSPVAATHDVGLLEPGLLEGGELAGVGEQPRRLGHAGGLDVVGVLVDEQHLVAVAEQLTGDGAADASGSGDDDAHGVSSPVAGQWAAGAWSQSRSTRARSSRGTVRCTRSPCWTTMSGRGSVPSPRRVT